MLFSLLDKILTHTHQDLSRAQQHKKLQILLCSTFMIHSRPITRGAVQLMDSTRLLSWSPSCEDDSGTDSSTPLTAFSSPASRMADFMIMEGSIPQSPELWADSMYADYPNHPTRECGLWPVTSAPGDPLGEQTLTDALELSLDPVIVPPTGLFDFDLSAEKLISAIPETNFIQTSMMESIPSREINQVHPSSSPRVNSHTDSQRTSRPSSRAKQRGWPSPAAEDSGVDACSLSPGSEEERRQERRRRNKLASRRLRQRHLNHVSELETRLGGVTQERDELRLRVAKWEGEAMALRKLLETRANE